MRRLRRRSSSPGLSLPDRRAFLAGMLALWTLGLVSCATAPSTVTSAECLAIAESYRSHRWTATERNVRHGPDRAGVRVETPDAGYRPVRGLSGWWHVGRSNLGMPYQWGGFDTLASFDAKVQAGYAAGDVYTLEKRRLLEAGVSAEAAGVDCSGFISRCWKLPRAYSTRALPTLCAPVPDWAALRPGDLFNTHNAHALLFAGWVTPDRRQALVYETGRPPAWKVIRHAVAADWLWKQGYRAWRYRGMARDDHPDSSS